MVFYGHGSWIGLVVFAGFFALRYLTSQRRGGNGPNGHHHRSGPMNGLVEPGRPGRPGSGAGLPDPPGGRGESGPAGAGAGTAPGWFRDPFFQHEHRYWSGTEWSGFVEDAGVPSNDPPPSPPSEPPDHIEGD